MRADAAAKQFHRMRREFLQLSEQFRKLEKQLSSEFFQNVRFASQGLPAAQNTMPKGKKGLPPASGPGKKAPRRCNNGGCPPRKGLEAKGGSVGPPKATSPPSNFPTSAPMGVASASKGRGTVVGHSRSLGAAPGAGKGPVGPVLTARPPRGPPKSSPGTSKRREGTHRGRASSSNGYRTSEGPPIAPGSACAAGKGPVGPSTRARHASSFSNAPPGPRRGQQGATRGRQDPPGGPPGRADASSVAPARRAPAQRTRRQPIVENYNQQASGPAPKSIMEKRRWVQQLPIPHSSNGSEVMRKLLGPGGSHVKRVAEAHGCKLRARGIGSGHLEGRNRREAQMPLHLCVSAPTQLALDAALVDAQGLIDRATGTSGKASRCLPTGVKLRLALVNEGKLSEASSFFLSGWAAKNEITACLVSEGALPGRSLATEQGFCWAVPLKQTKGGAGFLLREGAGVAGGKVKLIQCPQRRWSLSLWRTPGGTGLVSAYINPRDSQDSEVLGSFLAKLSGLIEGLPRCVIGGDFNARSGTPSRRALDSWCERQGFALANPGVLTHFVSGDNPGTDLDLVLARGVPVRMLDAVDPPQRGHLRQVFEVAEGAGQVSKPVPAPFAWKKLSCARAQERYIAAVKDAIETSPNLDTAIQRAAGAVLGRQPGPTQSRPLPPAVRREVVQLRRRAAREVRGSSEYQDLSRQIGLVMRRHRQSEWRTTLTKLASSQVVEADSWRLVKHLRKTAPTAKMVGIPDEEVRDTFSTIYQSNRVRRADWSLSATPGFPLSTEGKYPELDAAFTSQEVVEALNALPCQKAPGLDGVPHEAYKVLSRDAELVKSIADEATELLLGATAPALQGRLVAIPKKGAPEKAADMRPLMMLPTSRKVAEKLVAGRLDRLASMQGWDGMYPLQGGFRRGLCIERQLVLAQVAILDARENRRPLRMVGLDLVKAFDRIPREFAAHCAAGYLKDLCPRLADLIVRLTLAPFQASVGDRSFAVTTGVPQGGILSPWLFAMAMNDLALRLAGAGGYSVGSQQLGTLLYADDILLVDDSLDSSESRRRLTREWVEEWGGAIHPTKTQWIDVTTSSTRSGELAASDQGRAIDFLGVILTPKGIKPKVGAEAFADTLRAVRCTMEIRGLAPAPALQILRSVAWTKIAHGAAVTLPCAAKLTSSWLAAARQVLGTFKQVHRAEVQRELGLLLHPVAWLCKAVIRVYGTALTTDRDPVLRRVLVETVGSPSHALRRGVEATLLPSGITWEELAVVPVSDLLRKAEGRIREWSRQQLLDEAARLDLHRGANAPLWREWSDGPKKYLREENARYGFMFRRSSFAPPDLHTGACYFCGCPSGDWGRHLLECDAAKALVPLPETLAGLQPQLLAQALLLEDSTPVDRLRTVLAYMKELYAARQLRFGRSPQPPVKRQHISNPDFFKSGRLVAPRAAPAASTRGRRRRRSATAEEDAEATRGTRRRVDEPADPPPSPSQPLPAGEWDSESIPEDVDPLILLNEPCHEVPLLPEPEPEATPAASTASLKRGREQEEEEEGSPAAKRWLGSDAVEPSLSTAGLPEATEPCEAELHTVMELCDAEPHGTPEAREAELPAPMELCEIEPVRAPAPTAPCPGPARIERCDGRWTAEEEQELAAAALVHGHQSAAKLAKYVRTRTVRQIKVKLTTASFRQSLERLSESRKTPSVRRPSESSATAHLTGPALGGPTRPTPFPGLASLGGASQSQTVPSQGRFRDGRWSKEELDRLHAAARHLGHAATGEALSEAVGTRSARQCFDRLREKGTVQEIGAISLSSLGTVPGGCESYRWETEEVGRLVAAVNEVGGYGNPSSLAAIVGSRTAAQVAAKVRDLVTGGRLVRTGPSSFSLQ